MLVNSLMISRLDYCNSLLCDIPKYQRDKFQRIQNTAARMVTEAFSSDHITHIFKSLPPGYLWKQGLTLRFFLSHMKSWMDNLLDIWNLWLRNIIHKEKYAIIIPFVIMQPSHKNQNGGRTFSTAAPQLWYTIPEYIKNAESVATFKTKLKTLLFKEYFQWFLLTFFYSF